MRKAVISDRIYMSLKEGLLDHLTKALLYEFKVFSKTGNNTEEFLDVNRIANIVSIPVGRQDLIPPEYVVKDKRVIPKALFPVFKATLRDSQQKIHDKVEDNCLINATVGFGKTITALSLAHKFQTKTLVIVHTKFLLDQWIVEIEKWLGMTPSQYGGGKQELDQPIVVATIQTLGRRFKSVNDFSSMFGLVIIDEVHKTPATTYTAVLNKFKARYKIGLSGTLKRKDGKGLIIPDYFSRDIIQPKQENVMIPAVDLIYTNEKLEATRDKFAEATTKLAMNVEYILLLTALCEAYTAKGHKILLVSDRVFMLESLYDLVPNSVIVTGKTKDRNIETDKIVGDSPFNVLLGSISIFKEGISLNPLSCLILASPLNNMPMLEQLVGRIMRQADGKPNPVVVDIILRGGIASNQARNRAAHYRDKGYKLTEYTNNDEV